MKAARLTAPLLAAATLLLIGANAFPSVLRKHRLRAERHRLVRELERERARGDRLRAEVEALESDPFYLQRLCARTWRRPPRGAVPFDPDRDRDDRAAE